MTQKVYALVIAIMGGVEIIADAILVFCLPSKALATTIVACIKIATTAATEIMQKFVKTDTTSVEAKAE